MKSFLKLNELQEVVFFDSNSIEVIEKIFTLKNDYEIHSFIEYLVQRNALILSSSSPDLIRFLTNRVLHFSYDLLMNQIDAAVMIQVKKENRKKVLDEFIKKAAGKNPFFSLFINQAHLDLVANYLKELPQSPLLKSNLRASGVRVRCDDNCESLIQGYRQKGLEFLRTLKGTKPFSFEKYPETGVAEKLSVNFFNPLNEILGVHVADTFEKEVYFLTTVETIRPFEVVSSSREYRELVNREHSIQRLNNLLFLSLDDIFYQMNFTQITPVCVDDICSDILKSEDIGELLFHELRSQDDFKILRGKDFLIEIF